MSELSAPAGSEGCEARDADAPPQPEQEAERFPELTEQEPERLSLTGAPVFLTYAAAVGYAAGLRAVFPSGRCAHSSPFQRPNPGRMPRR